MRDFHPIGENLNTLRSYLRSEVEPPLADAIEAIATASKAISGKVRRARIEDVIGELAETNIQGETQQKLDVISNDLMLHCLGRCASVTLCGSEEEDEIVVVRQPSDEACFGVLFDPLDGSSNIDVAAGVGTIFSIMRCTAAHGTDAKAVLQPGRDQVAAGYVLYGSSTLLVLSCGNGVDMFVLDPDLGDFLLVKRRLEVPAEKKVRSINGAYRADFSEGVRKYLSFTEENGYGSRYIGSMVADVHRTLLKGGVFLYPPTAKKPRRQAPPHVRGQPDELPRRAGRRRRRHRGRAHPRRHADRAAPARAG